MANHRTANAASASARLGSIPRLSAMDGCGQAAKAPACKAGTPSEIHRRFNSCPVHHFLRVRSPIRPRRRIQAPLSVGSNPTEPTNADVMQLGDARLKIEFPSVSNPTIGFKGEGQGFSILAYPLRRRDATCLPSGKDGNRPGYEKGSEGGQGRSGRRPVRATDNAGADEIL